MDASAVIAMLGSAVSALFIALTGLSHRRIQTLEQENKALEAESKKYVAMILMASEGAEGLEELRAELARMLRES